MDSPIVSATWQAGALSALSNILGQVIKCYQADKSFTFNTADFTHFVLFAILSCPPNFTWQMFLESRFPGYIEKLPRHEKEAEKPKDNSAPNQPKPEATKSLSLRNTTIKFALDQTIGAAVNTLLFIAGIDFMRGRSFDIITNDCREHFWPIVFAGQKLWPAVSIANFTLVPVQYRTLVGSVVGLFWGVYLSLMSSSSSSH